MDKQYIINVVIAFALAVAVSFGATPVVRILAKNVGAIDVPQDGRRMHKTPIPRMGGLAIFLGFLCSVLLFGKLDLQMKSILIGAVLIVGLGIVDDIRPLSPKVKLIGQICAALVPVLNGVKLYSIANPFKEYAYITFGMWAIPITIFWIVAIVNAVNFIDGLDGLAVGISTIASFSLLLVALMASETYIVIIMAALAGACVGFLPFNMNPARIFMGDTGSMFLGYILAVMSVQGMFKFYTIVTFAVPFIILGLPIIDTCFAIVRRLIKGQSPFSADRGHMHHRLIDMGLSQKQSVAILYALSAVLGLSAVVLAGSGGTRIIILLITIALAVIFGIGVFVYDVRRERDKRARELAEGNGEVEKMEDSTNVNKD